MHPLLPLLLSQGKPNPRRRRFKLLRSFTMADFVTLGNAAAGTGSIFFCLNFLENNKYEPYIYASFILLPLALVFDIADGYVARYRQNSSPYGSDLDSLADVISFAVAPAVLGFTLGLRGAWDCSILAFFVCCGVSRLARYNVTAETLADSATGKVKYYQGFPVPTSLILVVLLGIAYAYGEWREDSAKNDVEFSNKPNLFTPFPSLWCVCSLFLGGVFNNMWLGEYRWSFPSSLPGTFHPFSLLFFLFGCAMVSEFPIPKP